MGENLENQSAVELAWAYKAYENAELHYDIITALDTSELWLSKCDDLIYTQFRKDFPKFDILNITEESLKSPVAKEKWRNFCNHFQTIVDEFNYGTLLRMNAMDSYTESNSLFATKIQFLAVEIARRNEGVTATIYKKALADRLKKREAGITPQTNFVAADTEYENDVNKLVAQLSFGDMAKK